MNRYKKLMRNSLIFGIGNFGSKLLLLLMVPLYTHKLTTSEYGIVDLVNTTIMILMPIFFVSIYEAIFRFTLDRNYKSEQILSSSAMVIFFVSILSVLFYPLLRLFNIDNSIIIYSYLILVLQGVQTGLAQYSRAAGYVKLFAVNGVIKTLILALSNVLLLIVFNLRIDGYLISIILSNIVSILIYTFSLNVGSLVSTKFINYQLLKQMVIYSIPLIPNSLMWWLVNSANRFFILHYNGVEVNGLFALASKMPAAITLVTSIFTQAWQLSAIEENNSSTKNEFYSKVFSNYMFLLFTLISLLLVILKPLFSFAFSDVYYPAWELVPFLLMGTVLSSLSSFIATNYIVIKETKGVFKTSIISGIVSIFVNLMLIPLIGAMGASLSVFFSFLLMFILRYNDSKKHIRYDINTSYIFKTILILAVQMLILYFNIDKLVESVLLMTVFLLYMYLNKNEINKLIGFIIRRRSSI